MDILYLAFSITTSIQVCITFCLDHQLSFYHLATLKHIIAPQSDIQEPLHLPHLFMPTELLSVISKFSVLSGSYAFTPAVLTQPFSLLFKIDSIVNSSVPMVISSLFSVHDTNIKRQFYWPTMEKDSLPRMANKNYLLCQFYLPGSLAQGSENL